MWHLDRRLIALRVGNAFKLVGLDRDATATAGELQGVRHEIQQYLHHAPLVCSNQRISRNVTVVDLDLDVLVRRLEAENVDDLFDRLRSLKCASNFAELT